VATKVSRNQVSLLAMIFVTSFAKLWIRLIGLNSFAATASSFFGIKVRYAELSSHNFLESPCCSDNIAAMKSAFITGQHDL
jgi:hypothetical protein